MNNLPWEIEKIISVSSDLLIIGSTAGSTSEQIAAAFVLNHQDYLPNDYSDMIEAWERLGSQWQHHVKEIKQNHMHLIKAR